mmetsp:Transcript_101865/g.328613  ORF Transcript_101865/g.328613 Transcript_101865/m.328613 type:complete len:200 (+) Transcript_101865:86-685(+)
MYDDSAVGAAPGCGAQRVPRRYRRRCCRCWHDAQQLVSHSSPFSSQSVRAAWPRPGPCRHFCQVVVTAVADFPWGSAAAVGSSRRRMCNHISSRDSRSNLPCEPRFFRSKVSRSTTSGPPKHFGGRAHLPPDYAGRIPRGTVENGGSGRIRQCLLAGRSRDGARGACPARSVWPDHRASRAPTACRVQQGRSGLQGNPI